MLTKDLFQGIDSLGCRRALQDVLRHQVRGGAEHLALVEHGIGAGQALQRPDHGLGGRPFDRFGSWNDRGRGRCGRSRSCGNRGRNALYEKLGKGEQRRPVGRLELPETPDQLLFC